MGITRVANVTGLDSIGIPVVMVSRPNARSLAVAQGKGVDLAGAKASGLMESVEVYHAESPELPLRLCSFDELRYSQRVVELGELPLVSTTPFSPNLRLLWCQGADLLNEESVFLPYELVHTDYTWPQPSGSGCFAASSNGLASGNHLLEAISHGVCEVVERDATFLWSLRGGAAQDEGRVDLATVDDPACRQVLHKFARAGVEVAVWETTSDVGIASYLCQILPGDADRGRGLGPAAGMGCHPARSVALLRALTEAAQSRLTKIAGSRDDIRRDRYAPGLEGEHSVLLHERLPRPPARRFGQAPNWESDTVDGDVAWELDRLRGAGIKRVISVDLTKEAFQLPVVRVVIPGLEGLHEVPAYVPGRRAQAVAAAAR